MCHSALVGATLSEDSLRDAEFSLFCCVPICPDQETVVLITLKCKFVILNPSHYVILSVAKNLSVLLRINSVKNLMISTYYETEILRLGPQNDIATQPPSRGMTEKILVIFSELKSIYINQRLLRHPESSRGSSQ